MLRHRRRSTQTKNNSAENVEEFSNVKNMFESLTQHKELKTELESLQIENKLNSQIRQFIDKRLKQLNKK